MNTHYLSPEELAHPHKVLEAFFDFATVAEAQACLGQWLIASLRAQDGQDDNYLHLYHHLDRLIVAGWLLYQRAEDQQLIPPHAVG